MSNPSVSEEQTTRDKIWQILSIFGDDKSMCTGQLESLVQQSAENAARAVLKTIESTMIETGNPYGWSQREHDPSNAWSSGASQMKGVIKRAARAAASPFLKNKGE